MPKTMLNPVLDLLFGHMLIDHRPCHSHEGCKVESAGAGQNPSLNSVPEYHLPVAQAAEIMGVSKHQTKKNVKRIYEMHERDIQPRPSTSKLVRAPGRYISGSLATGF